MFGEFCVKRGLISDSLRSEILELQSFRNEKFGRLLVELGSISIHQLNEWLSNYLDFTGIESVETVVESFEAKNAQFELRGQSIVVREADSISLLFEKFSDSLVKALEEENKAEVVLKKISKAQWVSLVKSLFPREKEESIKKEIVADGMAYKKLYLNILEDAKQKKASDVHFEPTPSGLRVRLRLIGDLKDYDLISKEYAESFLAEAKRLSGLPLVVTGRPADGEAVFENLNIKVRSSKVPTQFGDGLCLRVNNLEEKELLCLEKMGLRENEISDFRKALSFNNGVILISGQTGSGKSSTVFSMLMSLDLERKKVITLEDPIEHESEKLLQLKVSRDKMTFEQGLRSVLRHDPDVIVVGEIRDEETAKICFKAAATGHLVISTIHTNDAFNVINRLESLGVDRDSIQENLRMSVAQRLVKKVCGHCGISKKTKSGFEYRRNEDGCSSDECSNGYLNRRQVVVQYLDQSAIQNYLKNNSRIGIKTLQEVACEFAEDKIISHIDALAVS